MKARLHTSEKTKEILKEIQDRSNLRPNILSRIAINLSLLSTEPLIMKDYDSNGFEFHRHVLFGEFDILFKALISQKHKEHLDDEKFFPYYVKQHLERGIVILKNEFDYAGSLETFISNLIRNRME